MFFIRMPVFCVCFLLCAGVAPLALSQATQPVGPLPGDLGTVVSTKQVIRPAGHSVEFKGRPVDLVLSRDGKSVFIKSGKELLAIDVGEWQIRQALALPEKHAATMHGIAVSPDGSRVYYTTSNSGICEAAFDEADGKVTWSRTIEIKLPEKMRTRKAEDSYPCGIAISPDAKQACVCLSTLNAIAMIDLTTGETSDAIAVGNAPYGIALSSDGKLAYVTNWAGRKPREGEKTADSGGTPTVVNEHDIPISGTVSIVDLREKRQMQEIEVGLHPSDIKLSPDGRRAYVANANSDTVSVIDISQPTRAKVIESILVRPDPSLPFGSMSNALALSGDGKRLFVANGGNNAVAVIKLASGSDRAAVEGFIPAGWYPGALAVSGDGQQLFIANIKGVGSRDPDHSGKWNSHHSWGTVTKVDAADLKGLPAYTKQVMADALVPQTLRAWEKAQSGVNPVPVPAHVGEPSVFEHVVYIIKENRTYDQFLGDIAAGNGDASLCTFGHEITPNHHAIAEQFALLDNYYCNGVLSADGHAWATQGVAVDYLEKSFGAWVRSYPFGGDDAMAIAPTGFLWDNALLHGLSFRNYGEMIYTATDPRGASFSEVFNNHRDKTGKYKFVNRFGPDELKLYSHPTYPGWNLHISDSIRADLFIEEFEQFKQKGQWPNLVTIYLPQDHTSGTNPNVPTPRAMVADNDLAVGRIVEAISHSPFWPKTCIFVIEDDPQAGFDHVDGHRSICLVASPYTKRRAVVSEFYNQTSVLHTIELMLGLPPMNQLDAMAPVMTDCFTDQPDLTPYTALKNTVPIDEMNPPKEALGEHARQLAELSERQNFSQADAADEDALNRVLWHAMRGLDARYPAELAGAHGRGLKALHLKLDRQIKDDDD